MACCACEHRHRLTATALAQATIASIVTARHGFPRCPLSRPCPLCMRSLLLVGVAITVAQILLIYLTVSLAHPERSHGGCPMTHFLLCMVLGGSAALGLLLP